MDAPLLKTQKKQSQTLYKLNLGAGILHAANFITALVLIILYNDQSISATLTTDFNTTNVLGSYQLLWVELPFSAITSAFHLALSLLPESATHYNSYVFLKGYSPYRWIEYSVTASLMTWVILQIAGVTNVVMLVFVGVVCNVVLQYQGYLMEVMNPPKKTRTNWGPTVAGWLLFAGQWGIIWTYFANTVPAPWYVYSIVIGMFVQYSFFGLVQLLQFGGFIKAGYYAEMFYIALSYTSKFYLNWNLVISMLVNN